MVYQITNFTITLNLTNYTLLNGWMILTFDAALTFPNSANAYCLVNSNNGLCTLASNPIRANISVSSATLVYVININNIRNPSSTQFFSFNASVTDSNSISYYYMQSPYYQAATPYPLIATVTTSNCTNFASNLLNVSFAYLPFVPSSGVIRDS